MHILFIIFATNSSHFIYVGGVKGKDICGPYRGMEIRVDTQHCYACLEAVKHPEDGTLYETGHYVDSCYGYLL